MSEETEQQQVPKKTYRELWHDMGRTLLDIWNGGTQLNANNLSIIWNRFPVSQEVAERALQEYNTLFRTQYTLDQVDIPTLNKD